MQKLLKWLGIIIGGLLLLGIILVGSVFAIGKSRLNKSYNIEPESVAIPSDNASLERGKYIVTTTCTGCHGENLAGTVLLDDPGLGYFPAPNLTAGKGGIGGTYADADFVRSIRHGVRPNGMPLMIMPAGAFYYFSDADLGSIIAYVKSVPPVDNELGKKSAKPMGYILLGAGQFGDILAAETIDHTGPRPSAPAQAVNAAYGEYLVNTGDCKACHGVELSGAQPAEPGAPFAPNLTPGGDLANWTTENFIALMRTGKTPEGKMLDDAMPWEHIGRMTDDDLTAIFLFLESLPAAETAAQ